MCVLPRAILGGDEAVAQVAAAAAAEIRERLEQEAFRQALMPYQRMVRDIQERQYLSNRLSGTLLMTPCVRERAELASIGCPGHPGLQLFCQSPTVFFWSASMYADGTEVARPGLTFHHLCLAFIG